MWHCKSNSNDKSFATANNTRNSNSENNLNNLDTVPNPKIQNSTVVMSSAPLATLNEDPIKVEERIENNSNRTISLTPIENETALLSSPSTMSPRPFIIPAMDNSNTTNRPSSSTPRTINVDPFES